jgi:C4-dicarboxylate-specific signal transduction histidine kinase
MRVAVAGQLASALAHELNQPMTALLSYVRASELMAEPLASADDRLATTLRKAGEEAIRAAGVLRRLREFYRGDGVRLEQVDAAALCQRVAAALHDRIRGRGVELVFVDRTQLEIVVHNLLSNALDAFDAFPAAKRHDRQLQVTAQASGREVLIAVEDSGPGIPASVAERLFDPFVTSKVSGMGLGLSISRTFLRSQGGDLWVEPGRLGGARFVIRLATKATAQISL